MAWTSPRTWATGEVLTASNLNTHVRDNLNALSTHAHTGAAGDGAAAVIADWFFAIPNAISDYALLGDYRGVNAIDGSTTTVYFVGRFRAAPVSAKVVFIPTGGVNGQDIVWTTTSDFAAAGETYNLNSDGEATQVLDIPTMDVVQELELIGAFTVAAANDYFGLQFQRIGGNASDTLTGALRVLGLRVTYG